MATKTPFEVLVFSRTSGYRHDSISAGIACLQRLADQMSQFTITASEDATTFTPTNLFKYTVIGT